MWALKKRWWILVNKMPVYQALSEWQRAYWELDDEYNRKCDEYRLLYGKYMDLRDEVKYWEQRHSKVLYFIEKNWIEKAVEGESK